MIVPRPYQTRAIGDVRAAYAAGTRRVLLVAPTGAGKSTMLDNMLGRTKKRVLILAHRGELIRQIIGSLSLPTHEIGVGKDLHAQVHVGTMQTVARRLGQLPDYGWIISDEAHIVACPTWARILDYYKTAWHLGMSATPCRLDGKGLGVHYDTIIQGPSIKELQSLGFLVPCRTYRAPEPDPGKLVGDLIGWNWRLANGKRTIVFVSSIKEAEETAQRYSAAGIPATHIAGNMPEATIRARFDAFRRGEIKALVNVDLATTGVDIPEIECVQLARRTDSLSLYLQMIGRGLRIAPHIGKRELILIDHAGNSHEHGLPEMDREWGLDGAAKRIKPAISIRQCSECYAVYAPAPKCPQCGHAYEIKQRKGPKQIDGDLAQALGDAPALPPLKEHMKGAKTLEDFLKIAQQRGYKSQWAHMQVAIRRRWVKRAA